VDEIRLYNTPTSTDNRDTHWDFYAQDIWSPTDRLTLSIGARFGRQDIHYLGSTQSPTLSDFFPAQTFEAADLIAWNTLAPRIGATIDVTGKGKSVFKAYYGRYYSNAATMAFFVNPGANAFVQYKFADTNGNGVYDGREELGAYVTGGGGASGTVVDPDMKPAYADEFSFSLEHELKADMGVRFSYVRKQTRNNWVGYGTPTTVNLARREEALTQNVDVPCIGCPLGFEGTTMNLRTLPDGAPVDDLQITNAPGDTDGNFDTIQFAFNRRFSQSFFMNANFDYQWKHEIRGPDFESQSPLSTDPILPWWVPQYTRNISHLQDSTNWRFNAATRYEAGHGIGLAGTLRVQSGFPWAPIHRVDLPNVGTVPIFLENIENHYSDTVTIVDFRADKAFIFGGKYTATVMADVYNLLNTNAETNFILRTGSGFNQIIEWVGGRTLKIGLRFQF
jgi:outer membrane receptor protein involved in Fe transport